jgi:hypothetical protein
MTCGHIVLTYKNVRSSAGDRCQVVFLTYHIAPLSSPVVFKTADGGYLNTSGARLNRAL